MTTTVWPCRMAGERLPSLIDNRPVARSEIRATSPIPISTPSALTVSALASGRPVAIAEVFSSNTRNAARPVVSVRALSSTGPTVSSVVASSVPDGLPVPCWLIAETR